MCCSVWWDALPDQLCNSVISLPTIEMMLLVTVHRNLKHRAIIHCTPSPCGKESLAMLRCMICHSADMIVQILLQDSARAKLF